MPFKGNIPLSMEETMEALIRQTSFTLEKLEELLNSGSASTCFNDSCAGSYPAAMLANEIGYIFVVERNKNAERILVNLLGSSDTNVRFVAYCMLHYGFALIGEDAMTKLEVFGHDPSNARILEASRRYFPDDEMRH